MVLGEIVRESERGKGNTLKETSDFFPRGLLSSFERKAREVINREIARKFERNKSDEEGERRLLRTIRRQQRKRSVSRGREDARNARHT